MIFFLQLNIIDGRLRGTVIDVDVINQRVFSYLSLFIGLSRSLFFFCAPSPEIFNLIKLVFQQLKKFKFLCTLEIVGIIYDE